MKPYIKLVILFFLIFSLVLCNITAAAEEDDTLKKKTMIEVASKQLSSEEREFLLSPDSYYEWFDYESLGFDENTDFIKVYHYPYDEEYFFNCLVGEKSFEEMLDEFDTDTYAAINNNGNIRTLVVITDDAGEKNIRDETFISGNHILLYKDFFCSEASVVIDNEVVEVTEIYFLWGWDAEIHYYMTEKGMYIYYDYNFGNYNPSLLSAEEFKSKITEYTECKNYFYYNTSFADFLNGNYVIKYEESKDNVIVYVLVTAIFAGAVISYLKHLKKYKLDKRKGGEYDEKAV